MSDLICALHYPSLMAKASNVLVLRTTVINVKPCVMCFLKQAQNRTGVMPFGLPAN